MKELLEFRQAKLEDVLKIVKLLADDPLGVLREDPSEPLVEGYLKAFAAIEKDPNNELTTVWLKDQLVGCMQITFIPYLTHQGSWRALIEGVRIHRDFRSQGLGEKMIEYAIQRAKEKGCSMVQLTTTKTRSDAIRFYEKLGFQVTHEGMKLNL